MISAENPTDPRISPEKRVLLAAVILAVSDACRKPGKMDPSSLAMEAHDFLWGPRLDMFLHWVDIDSGWFRRNLMLMMEDTSATHISHFNSDQRRAFRVNHRIWATRFKDRGYGLVDIQSWLESDDTEEEHVEHNHG